MTSRRREMCYLPQVLCNFLFIYSARIYLLNIFHSWIEKKKGCWSLPSSLQSIWKLAYKQIRGCASVMSIVEGIHIRGEEAEKGTTVRLR